MARLLDEVERIEAIDLLADKLLNLTRYAGTPATEVWDIAAAIIDQREAAKLLCLA